MLALLALALLWVLLEALVARVRVRVARARALVLCFLV
jgi:hypothetical protein